MKNKSFVMTATITIVKTKRLEFSDLPRINDTQVAEVLHEKQNIANTNPLEVSGVNAISKRLQILRKILKIYPHILQRSFELKQADLAIRYDFSLPVFISRHYENSWPPRSPDLNPAITRHFENSWPPRSSDLNSADFWVWGYLKKIVYRIRPNTLEVLKDSITEKIAAIQSEILYDAVCNLEAKLVLLYRQNGRHIEQ